MNYQQRVWNWVCQCFGVRVASDITERCDRFIEEALEQVQSVGYDLSRVDALVKYVGGRPNGDPHQEAGGVMVTFAALCAAANIDMDVAGADELARISQPDVMDKIRRKQANKARDIPFSPLPQAVCTCALDEPCVYHPNIEPGCKIEIPLHTNPTLPPGYVVLIQDGRPVGIIKVGQNFATKRVSCVVCGHWNDDDGGRCRTCGCKP